MTTQLPIPYDDLPLWMRQARQEFDWSILIALAMSLAIAWTFILRSDIPAGHQLEHFVFQAENIVTGFEEGRFYPRWSPYALNGYGAPIPNYYPIGTAYIVAVIESLFTNDLIQAVRITFILTYAIAGTSTYLFVSRRTDASIGLLATVLYLYSPMLGLTIPYAMGDLALLMASALLPLILWTSTRLISYSNASDFAIHSLAIGLFLWIHPPMLFFSITIAFIYFVFDPYITQPIRQSIRLSLATVLGCLLPTLYWMPAIFESNLVHWHNIKSTNDYALTFEQTIAPIQQIDAGLLMPQPQFKVGWLILILSIVTLVTLRWSPDIPKRFYFTMFLSGLVLFIYAVVFNDSEVWLLIPITFCFSVFASGSLYLRQYLSTETSRLLTVFSVAFILIFSLPVWLIPDSSIVITGTDVIAQLRYEQQGYGIATLPDSQPIPSTIESIAPVNRFLINSYELGSPQRYDEQQNNANTIVSLLETASHQQTYRIFNAIPRDLQFLVSYFDGWQAFLNNQPIPTFANAETGLLTVTVPRADNDELTIRLTDTSIRSLSWNISLATLCLIILIAFFGNRRGNRVSQDIRHIKETMPRSDVRLMLFMFLCLGLFIGLLTIEPPILRLQNSPAFTLSQSLPLQSRGTGGFEATTFEINKRNFTLGETIEVTIYWQGLTAIQSNYKSRVLLRDTRNRLIWYTGELQSPGSVASRRWVRNRYVKDTHFIAIPDELILGDYEILVQVYPCDTTSCNLDAPIIFFNINGDAVGHQLALPLTINLR